jgi:hypothetical protein
MTNSVYVQAGYVNSFLPSRNDLALYMFLTLVLCISFFFFTWQSSIAMMVACFALLKYISALGKGLAILELMGLVAVLQLLIGPLVAYYLQDSHPKYHMYVGEIEYMNYVLPATVFYLVGLNLLNSRVHFEELLASLKHKLEKKPRIGFFLILLGFAFEAIVPYLPGILAFVGFLIAQFKYVGIIYVIFSGYRHSWAVVAIFFVVMLITAVGQGLFHNLLIWAAFLLSYLCNVLKLGYGMKMSLIFFGLLSIMSIQMVKSDYRQKIWFDGHEGSEVNLFFRLIEDDWESSSSLGTRLKTLNVRLNQGWIVSAVMNHMPGKLAFLKGETIWDAIKESLIPRLLVEKRELAARENFFKFTGIPIKKNTSMGVGVMGEAYANFGSGGMILMFFWGLFSAWVFAMMMAKAQEFPTLILWVPLVFLQMVKVETELSIVLNHGVKSLILVVAFYLFTRIFLKLKI